MLVANRLHNIDHKQATSSLRALGETGALDGHDFVVAKAITANGVTVPTREDLEAGRVSDELPVFVRSKRMKQDWERLKSVRDVVLTGLPGSKAQFAEVVLTRHRARSRASNAGGSESTSKDEP